MFKKLMVTVTALAAAMLTLTTTAGTAQADPAIPGTYNTVRPTRLLDTRAGLGTTKMPLAAGARCRSTPSPAFPARSARSPSRSRSCGRQEAASSPSTRRE